MNTAGTEPNTLHQPRLISIDATRGLIMVIMALDHASVTWNAGRSLFEAGLPPLASVGYTNLAQQIAREVTHVCAPGFQLLAGMGLAISVGRRRAAGVGEVRITSEILLRAAVLFFCEWVLLHMAMGGEWFFFVVLCCIGSSMILFTVVRVLPLTVIAVSSFAVLLAAPLYCPAAIVDPTGAGYLRNIWTNVVLAPQAARWQVLYPILPWVGFFGIGWCLGQVYHRRPEGRRSWLTWLGLGLFALGAALRWFGGAYGDRLAGGSTGPWSPEFWMLAKYPPTPAFSMITAGLVITMLGALGRLDRRGEPGRVWRIIAVYGQVALFFYVFHFHLYGAYPFLTDTMQEYSLSTTCGVWIAGLIALWPICAGYAWLRRRYRVVLRYF